VNFPANLEEQASKRTMLEPQQVLQNRYQLQQQLGKNAIRQTWLAEDLETQDRVIVKLLAFGGNVQWQELKLFEREAQILKQLEHPRISKYRDYFSLDDQTLWFGLVKDYIPGQSLQELLTAGKRFQESEIERVAREVLEVLVYLHGLHPPVLHRDIKPSNLILGEDEQVYLVDFGAVQDKAATEGSTFTVVGTYGYAAMEQFGGRAVPASDLYALGATLIHLLTGVSPAELPTRNLTIQFRDRVSVNTNSALITWIEKLTQPAVERRFSRAQAALEALDNQRQIKKRPQSHRSDTGQPLILPANTNLRIYKTDSYLKVDCFSGFTDLQIRHPQFLYSSLGILIFFGLFAPPLAVIFMIIVFSLLGTQTVHRFLIGSTLMFRPNRYLIEKDLLGITYSKESGQTSLITEVSLDYQPYRSSSLDHRHLEYRISRINIISATSPVRDVFKKHTLGKGLSDVELSWLVEEIKGWLSSRVDDELGEGKNSSF
jgi:serine/threonine protein kinase